MTGPQSPGRLRNGLLIGLVLVLLAMCGGLALTAWTVVGPDSALGASPTSSASGATAGHAPSTPSAVVPVGPTGSPTPSDGRTVAPPASAPLPFGMSHAVVWPDHLQAVVWRARQYDLHGDQAAEHPLDVAVLITMRIDNNTAADVVIRQAALKLWYGPDHTPAEQFVDTAEHFGGGFDSTIRTGRYVTGDFAFLVPRQYITQLALEFRPRPGDAPGLFVGEAF